MKMKKTHIVRLIPLLLSCLLLIPNGAISQIKKFEKVIVSSAYKDLNDFKDFALKAKKAGATHVDVGTSLPASRWEYIQDDDPYPGWTVNNASLLKIATPKALQPYIPQDYTENALSVLDQRCKVLRGLGLKAYIWTVDPYMLPEAVYRDHPLWRGPRVDHPSRSRVPRFSPAVDNPEVLDLYKEAVTRLLTKCPEIDIIQSMTNDSGGGMDWSPGLYNGPLGNSLYRNIPMHERVGKYLKAYLDGAQEAGQSVDVNLHNTREKNPAQIAQTLQAGMAIDHLEGPNAERFMVKVGIPDGYFNAFTPVIGIPQPLIYIKDFMEAAESQAKRIFIRFTDPLTRDLYFDIMKENWESTPKNIAASYAQLHKIAVAQGGEAKANALTELWVDTDEVRQLTHLLNTGGFIFNLGCIHQRWIIRPFVPFPDKVSDEDKKRWQEYQFQALPERMNHLADVQGTDAYYGWSGRHFVKRVIVPMERFVNDGIRQCEATGDAELAKRLKIYKCFIVNAKNAVSYQAQLDRVAELGIKPLKHAVIETEPSWDRQLIMETARQEIDNTAILLQLLGNNPYKYIHMAETQEEEDIKLLGPKLLEHLNRKMVIMNDAWEDYKEIFTTPNW